MSYPPPPKRARFSIDDILSMDTQQSINGQEVQSGNGQAVKDPSDYASKLDNNIEKNDKFKMVKVKSRWLIKNLPADPEALLGGIFQYCIDETIKDSENGGFKADNLGCTISSEILNSDVYVPIRPINDNTVDAILNRFLLVGQSKKQDDVTLWGQPFTICVTTVCRTALPDQRELKGGSRRKLAALHHNINGQCLIKVF